MMESPKVFTGLGADRSRRHTGRRPTTSIRVAVLHSQGYSVDEIALKLHISINAVRCALRGLKVGRLRHPLGAYCPACLSPSVRDGVCHSCGAERDGPVSPPILAASFLEHSEPTGLSRVNHGLGSSAKQTNALLSWLRKNGGTIRMRDYLDLETSGDPAFVRTALEKVISLGNFREGDFTMTESAGYLVRKLSKLYLARYSELSRKRLEQLVTEVLSELYDSFGPARVRLDPATLELIRLNAQLHRAGSPSVLKDGGGYSR